MAEHVEDQADNVEKVCKVIKEVILQKLRLGLCRAILRRRQLISILWP